MEKVYDAVIKSPQMELWERITRFVSVLTFTCDLLVSNIWSPPCRVRTMELGPFAGPIYTIILIVDCIFFLFLEWWLPRENMQFVTRHWDEEEFQKVCIQFTFDFKLIDLVCVL
jgi:phosphatidylinositol N-acetylglucosaminyltransferase subunit A